MTVPAPCLQPGREHRTNPQESANYNRSLQQSTLQHAILPVLRKPPAEFAEVVRCGEPFAIVENCCVVKCSRVCSGVCSCCLQFPISDMPLKDMSYALPVLYLYLSCASAVSWQPCIMLLQCPAWCPRCADVESDIDACSSWQWQTALTKLSHFDLHL